MQIRDEILNIMHRNHVGEKSGTWMEQWHQKLVTIHRFTFILLYHLLTDPL